MERGANPTFDGMGDGIRADEYVSDGDAPEKYARCTRPRSREDPHYGGEHGDHHAARGKEKPENARASQRGFRLGGRLQIRGRFPAGAPDFGSRQSAGLKRRSGGLPNDRSLGLPYGLLSFDWKGLRSVDPAGFRYFESAGLRSFESMGF
jgi:hypothetical protein